MNRVELKQRAKDSLQGKYGDAILILLILGGAGFLCGILEAADNGMISFLGGVGTFVVTGLFTFGSLSFYLKLSRNEEVTYKEVFSKMNMFLPYVLISLLIGVFSALWSLLFVIPGIIAGISYSQAYLIALENPDIDPMDAIRESKKMMDGHKMDYFVLMLSFLGWALLGALTLGLLYFWLLPYISATQVEFYNSIKNK